MKKTALLIYETYCNFEISVALEGLALKNKEVVVFAKYKDLIKSEEGLTVLPDRSIDEIIIDEYDSLLLPGAADIRSAIEDKDILNFIKKFKDKIIGAISIAPILLVKTEMLNGKPFMAGVNKEDLFEEGFTNEDLDKMKGWDDCIKNPIEDGYIVTDKIVTSIAFNFAKFGLQFCKMLGLDIPPQIFGL
ncbi:glutamine amidotransferase [Treponema sp. OMZ 799]|uniref:DJ-1/PfpI family protein n=1 Tax=Treponema sp. OMZ 799 TaxID=2563668 RepID=UPI0020A61A84|nr:DJ-1/PfpI family protein [Treponema sp. OMZ 799]UTC77772.1 glutamine amidotransferase [Treponema sp. OMZ 799]